MCLFFKAGTRWLQSPDNAIHDPKRSALIPGTIFQVSPKLLDKNIVSSPVSIYLPVADIPQLSNRIPVAGSHDLVQVKP